MGWALGVWDCMIREKFPQRIWMQGHLSWCFAHHLTSILKLYLYVRQRYGNPDMQFWATLKYQLWFQGFYIMLMLNIGLILIFRVAIYFLTWLFCVHMATLNWNYHFYAIWTYYCWIICFLSRICLRNQRYIFTLQHNRVSIFLADLEIWFQNWWQMMGKTWAKITMHSDSLGKFFSNLAYCETPSGRIHVLFKVLF